MICPTSRSDDDSSRCIHRIAQDLLYYDDSTITMPLEAILQSLPTYQHEQLMSAAVCWKTMTDGNVHMFLNPSMTCLTLSNIQEPATLARYIFPIFHPGYPEHRMISDSWEDHISFDKHEYWTGCPNVLSIDFIDCTAVTHSFLYQSSIHLSHLKHLRFVHCPGTSVNDDEESHSIHENDPLDLETIVHQFQFLESLVLENCSWLTHEHVQDFLCHHGNVD